MAEANKIDSNNTGLRIAEESSLATLPGSPVWYDLEPNSYNDFGGQLTLVARNPISNTRQRKKGVITDLDASGGFNQDLTFTNLSFLMPGIFLASKSTKTFKVSDGTGSGGPSPIESIGSSDDIVFDVDMSALIYAGDLIWLEGFANSGNNGLKSVASVSTDTVTVNETLTAEATAPSGASCLVVGFEHGSGDAAIAKSANQLPTLTDSTKNLTQLGLVPGEFIFVGGDDTGASGDAFNAAHNNGWCRVQAVTANAITFDKTSGGADGETEMVTEAGGSKTIRLFFGNRLKNVGSTDSLFDRKTYTLERKLDEANPTSNPGEIQSEALQGAMANEFALNVTQADKVTCDWTFIATANVQRDGSSGSEPLSDSGSVQTIEEATAYNTSSDIQIKMAEVRPTQGGSAELAAPIPLFAYVTEMTLNVNNNGQPNKAVSVLGAFDVTAGTFEVSGSITAYFADIASVVAVRNNTDVTLDMKMVKDFGTGTLSRKAGIVIDVPLIALGDGRLSVEQDEAVTLPLTTDAAEYTPFGHTLMFQEFTYLPDAADV
jgi:hypothetical protein